MVWVSVLTLVFYWFNYYNFEVNFEVRKYDFFILLKNGEGFSYDSAQSLHAFLYVYKE